MTAKRRAQIARWQKAGSRARKSKPKAVIKEQAKINRLMALVGRENLAAYKPMPMGKTVLLYHRTPPNNAKSLVRKGFEPGHLGTGQRISKEQRKFLLSIKDQSAFFVRPKSLSSWKGYGSAVVGVKVPRKLVEVDENSDSYYPPPLKVSYKNLKGRKVKRVR